MSERDFYVDSDACTEGEKKPIAFADLFGYIPNITGGLSVAEYVAGINDSVDEYLDAFLEGDSSDGHGNGEQSQ